MVADLLAAVIALQGTPETLTPLRDRLDELATAGLIVDECQKRKASPHAGAGARIAAAMSLRARSLFGDAVDAGGERPAGASVSPACMLNAEYVAFDHSVRAVDMLLKPAESRIARGVWIGLMPLCAETLLAVTRVPDRDRPSRTGFEITFGPAFAALFERYSARLVAYGGLLPPLRLEGTEIVGAGSARTRGGVRLTGLSAVEGDRLDVASSAACAIDPA